MDAVNDAKEAVLNAGSQRPGILIGIIIILVLAVLYFAFKKDPKKKTVKKKEEIEEDEDIVDNLIEEINEKQKDADD